MNEFKKMITLQNMLRIQMLCLDLCLLRLGTTQEEESSKDNNIPTSTKHFKVLLYLPYLGAVEQCWIKIYIQFIHQLKVQSYLTPVYFFCKWEWYFRLILMNDLTLVTPSKNTTCMEYTGMQHTFMSIQLCNANKDNQLEVHKNAARCVN